MASIVFAVMKALANSEQCFMKCLFALLLLVCFLSSAEVLAQEIQCPGQNTIEMRYCASLDLDESSNNLRSQLPVDIFNRWQQTTKEVCAKAYAPYKQVTIYPQMITRCDDSLNRALLQELRGLGEH